MFIVTHLNPPEPRPSIRRAAWGVYTHRLANDQRCVVFFDQIAAEEELHVESGEGRRLILFPSTRAEGRDCDASSRLVDSEAKILEALEASRVDCLLVGKLSYHRLSELVFQVEDAQVFDQVIARWMAAYDLRCDLVPYTGWTFFDEAIRPRHADWLNLKPQEIEQTFAGQEDLLISLELELRQQGFRRARRGRCVLTVARSELLFGDDVAELTDPMATLAVRHGVTYRGWSRPEPSTTTAN